MSIPTDLVVSVVALTAAVGSVVAKPPVSRWLALSLLLPPAIAVISAVRGVAAPWWLGPAATLALGVAVYAGLPVLGLVRHLVVVVAGVVLGLVMARAAGASGWPGVIGSYLAVLVAAMVLTFWTSRRGGAWACQTDRLVGGLVAFAGAALLILGSNA